MDGHESPRRRRVPWGLVGMVALIGAIEAGVSRFHDDLASWASAQFDFAARAAGTEAVGSDLLCFGDSVLSNGVVPAIVGRRAGLDAYNLATIGNPPAVAHALLRRALEAGARPRAVIVDFKWGIIRETHRPYLQAYAELAGFRDALELAWTAGDPDYFAAFAIARALPSAKDRVSIRAAILAVLRGREPMDRRSKELLRRNWRVNRGAQVLAPHPPAWTATEFPDPGGRRPEDWSCNPTNRAYIGKFFRLASRHGIPVYWLLNPIHPSNQARRDRLGVDERWTRFVRSIPRPSNVVVVDARRLGLDGTHFADGGHPDRRGAAALSAALGSWLRDRPASGDAGGWVNLPPAAYHPSEEGPLEDINQSAMRIDEGARRR